LKFSFETINFVVDMADQGGPEYGDSSPPPPPAAARRGGDYFDAQQSGVDSYADRAANGDRKREVCSFSRSSSSSSSSSSSVHLCSSAAVHWSV
jgi:hypothetical protein